MKEQLDTFLQSKRNKGMTLLDSLGNIWRYLSEEDEIKLSNEIYNNVIEYVNRELEKRLDAFKKL